MQASIIIFCSTLRVLRLTSENRNFRNIFESFGQVLDGFRLVVFNADEGLLDAEDFHADLDARDEFVRRFLFDHGTIVTSQIRFTFGTVDDERIDRFVRSQFGREPGKVAPPQPTTPAFLDEFQDFLAVELLSSREPGESLLPIHLCHLLR